MLLLLLLRHAVISVQCLEKDSNSNSSDKADQLYKVKKIFGV